MLSSLWKLRVLFARAQLKIDKMTAVETDFKRLKTGLGGNEDVILNFVKLTDNAYTPTRGSDRAAGLDLYSAYEYTVPAHGKALVKTDLQIALPNGCYGRIAPRSGLANKYFIDVGAGVIDADYRGNIGVILFNHGDEDFHVKKGDRIAQLILERIYTCSVVQCKTLSDTERGMNGFGSTGLN